MNEPEELNLLTVMEAVVERGYQDMLRRMRSTPEGRKCLKSGHKMSGELRDEMNFVYFKCLRCGEETWREPNHINCRCDWEPVGGLK